MTTKRAIFSQNEAPSDQFLGPQVQLNEKRFCDFRGVKILDHGEFNGRGHFTPKSNPECKQRISAIFWWKRFSAAGYSTNAATSHKINYPGCCSAVNN
uniref:Uncharacterized protein n=1 Tax=Romanomermis culicivorax TaxID=13658 RepID=A0A915L0R7_ROMCU